VTETGDRADQAEHHQAEEREASAPGLPGPDCRAGEQEPRAHHDPQDEDPDRQVNDREVRGPGVEW
jgi:hypothetical protein